MNKITCKILNLVENNKCFTTFILVSQLILIPHFIFSQDYCDQAFTDNEFSSIQKVELKYGRAPEATGYLDSIDLLLDLYYSTENDQTIQPILFLLHGGSYIAELGNKSSMEEYARLMVSKGFVVVSVGYRTWSYLLGGTPTKDDVVDVAVKAMLDLQSAIDFVVDASGHDGFPEVDLQHMIIGGGSSGAITINHRLYIDAQDSLPDFLSTAFENNGGLFERNSDEYDIAYGLNMSGGIFDTVWIDAGEPPLVSIHGDADSVVFYDRGLANGVLELYGSKPIDERLNSQGIDSYFYTFKGGGHSNIYGSDPAYRDIFLNVLDTALMIIQDALCPTTTNTSLETIQADVKLVNTLVGQELIVANHESESMRYEIIDLKGRTIQSGVLQRGRHPISFTSPVAGYFAFRAYGSRVPTGNSSISSYQQLFYYAGR